MKHLFSTQWAGRTLSIEVGRLAGQANGAALIQYGDTVVLATAVMSGRAREGVNYLPLMVDYEERLYAAGKIKSSRFIKREGRPTDEAILSGRMIDRSIRPLFDGRIRTDIQVVTTVLSVDGENDSDIPAFIGASAALMISDIPWDGPIAAIRVGRVEGEWVLNPTYEARTKSDIDIVIAGTPERIIMLEAGANEVTEADVKAAITFGQKHLHEAIDLIREAQTKIGKPKVALTFDNGSDPDAAKVIEDARVYLLPKIRERFFTGTHETKSARRDVKVALKADLETYLTEKSAQKEYRKAAGDAVDSWIEEEITSAILERAARVDGRKLDEIRPLSVEVGLIPRTHGSGLFARGETQVLSTVTLGSPGDELTLDQMEVTGKRRFFHHYNFPSYSVGETGPNRGPGRRDIGHGALAERAISAVMPSKEEFPYTVRVVSEVLSSNGSSSMGSTCGSSLALMDAGVPVRAQVAGVAMGLASNDDQYKILTDLQDLEDGKGGMDFKVAGTRTGIVAIQMDTKTKGLTPQMVSETLDQAKAARSQILDKMDAVIPERRAELSQYAPRIISIKINPELIRNVIGPGGKTINEIIEKTGVQIDVEQTGLINVTAVNAENAAKAIEWIKTLTREVKVGEVFEGKVSRIMDFGAFVEIAPRQDGMVHVSELADHHVGTVTDAVNIGDTVKVKVIEIDDQGRINLSIRQAANPDAPVQVRERPPRRSGPPFRGGDRGPRDHRAGGGHGPPRRHS